MIRVMESWGGQEVYALVYGQRTHLLIRLLPIPAHILIILCFPSPRNP